MYRYLLKKNPLLLALVFILFIGLFSGCEKKEVVTIQFRITWDNYSGRGEVIQSIIDSYNVSQDEVKVELISGDEDYANTLSSIDEGSVDIYMLPYRYVQDQKISKSLYPLTEYFKDEIDLHYSDIKDLSSVNNVLLGVPWIGHSMALVYNETLCDGLGVNPQEFKDLSDLLDACEIVEEKTNASGIGLVGGQNHDITWMVNQFIYSFGGNLVDENGEIAVKSAEAEEAISFYKNTLGKYAQEGWKEASGIDVLNAFSASQVAFEIQGPWAISDIWKKGNPFEVSAISLGQIGLSSEVAPMMLCIPADVLYKEEAVDFISYLVKKDNLMTIMNGEFAAKYDAYFPFRVPIRQDVIDADFMKRYPDFEPFVLGFENASISTPNEVWATKNGQKYEQVLHQIMVDEIEITEGLEELNQ